MSREELDLYFASEEGKQAILSIIDNEETNKDIDDKRNATFLKDDDDVKVQELCNEIEILSTKCDLTDDDRKKIFECLKKLEEYKDGAAKDLMNEKGHIDIFKAIDKSVKFNKEYATKENWKTMKKLGRKDIANMSPQEKKQMLEAAYTLYNEEGGKYKRRAMAIFMKIPGLAKMQKDGEFILNVNMFQEMYASLSGCSLKDMNAAKMNLLIHESQSNMVLEHILKLSKEVDNGTLGQGKREDELEQEASGEQKNNEIKYGEQFLRDKSGGIIKAKLRPYYRIGKIDRAVIAMNEKFKDVSEEEKARAVMLAYEKSITEYKDSDKYKNSLLKEYMVSRPDLFSSILMVNEKGEQFFRPPEEIRKIAATYTSSNQFENDSNNERRLNDEEIEEILDTFSKINDHKRTPALLIRGAKELVKGFTKFTYGIAKVNVLSILNKQKLLLSGEKSNDQKNGKKIDKELESIQKAIDNGEEYKPKKAENKFKIKGKRPANVAPQNNPDLPNWQDTISDKPFILYKPVLKNENGKLSIKNARKQLLMPPMWFQTKNASKLSTEITSSTYKDTTSDFAKSIRCDENIISKTNEVGLEAAKAMQVGSSRDENLKRDIEESQNDEVVL